MITLQKDKYLVSPESPQLFYKEEIASGNGETVLVKPNAKGAYSMSVAIEAGAGTGKVQYTLDTEEIIEAGTEVWYDWDIGDATGNAVDAFVSPVSAVRGVSISGAVVFKLLI